MLRAEPSWKSWNVLPFATTFNVVCRIPVENDFVVKAAKHQAFLRPANPGKDAISNKEEGSCQINVGVEAFTQKH